MKTESPEIRYWSLTMKLVLPGVWPGVNRTLTVGPPAWAKVWIPPSFRAP
ncbi:MAG TPA: hypothetical protein VLR45_00550 [Desulfoprunum sp.]|nr:hypothetical protein [Desulfoprunum sp.]